MTWNFIKDNFMYYRDNFEMPEGSKFLGKNFWLVNYPAGVFLKKDENWQYDFTTRLKKISLNTNLNLIFDKNMYSLICIYNYNYPIMLNPDMILGVYILDEGIVIPGFRTESNYMDLDKNSFMIKYAEIQFNK